MFKISYETVTEELRLASDLSAQFITSFIAKILYLSESVQWN